jgi:hypothetical protein
LFDVFKVAKLLLLLLIWFVILLVEESDDVLLKEPISVPDSIIKRLDSDSTNGVVGIINKFCFILIIQ